MKILLIGEYSGLHNELKKSLLELGHNVVLASGGDFWKGYDSDIKLAKGKNIFTYKASQFILPLVYLKKFTGYDVVHIINFYTFPRALRLNYWFIKFLKNNNSILTMAGAGDDPFYVNNCAKVLKYNPIESHEKYDRKNPYYMRKASHTNFLHKSMQHIDLVIPIMYEYYSTYKEAGYELKVSKPVPIPIDCTKIKYSGSNNNPQKKLILFHGLNRPGFKGTHIVEKCFSALNKKYSSDVECVIKGSMLFSEYMHFIEKVDVSVDQVFSYSLAMNALYSMAQGKVVVGGSEVESFIVYDGMKPPVYNANPNEKELTLTCEYLLSTRENNKERGLRSREFVEKYHNSIDSAEKYLKLWSSLN